MTKKRNFLFLGCFLLSGFLLFNLSGEEARGKELLDFTRIDYQDLPEQIKSWVDNSRKQEIAQTKNFAGYTYILVTYGEKPTGGYRVEIQELQKRKDSIEIFVEFQAPAADQMVTQAFTYPYDLVRIKATDIPFQFTALGEKEHVMELRGIDRLLPVVASSDWIKVFNPTPGEEVGKSFTVEGMASTFEGNILYRLIDSQGKNIKDGFTTAGMGDWYYFEIVFSLEELFEPGENFSLELYTESPKDGSRENLVTIPLSTKKD